ncbi:hypothetical protein MAPG_05427 [Magnaporthiopsis poae ATCC 64411]|uniref:Uncharacterized protein n=1 Tax=Magnaporthiopsis poae (strain ATCC 64411 / 73-15) TaxID=644358 RepID=A0A0C4DZD2_MAGP6|nr:hypothetical protein MAPG_05427 [Magnaporthiopsis poae ATCC 64411]
MATPPLLVVPVTWTRQCCWPGLSSIALPRLEAFVRFFFRSPELLNRKTYPVTILSAPPRSPLCPTIKAAANTKTKNDGFGNRMETANQSTRTPPRPICAALLTACSQLIPRRRTHCDSLSNSKSQCRPCGSRRSRQPDTRQAQQETKEPLFGVLFAACGTPSRSGTPPPCRAMHTPPPSIPFRVRCTHPSLSHHCLRWFFPCFASTLLHTEPLLPLSTPRLRPSWF